MKVRHRPKKRKRRILKRGKWNVTNASPTKRKSSSVLSVDPTRTGALRRAFEAQLSRTFNSLKRAVTDLIVGRDAFGLKPAQSPYAPTENMAPNQPRVPAGNPRGGEWTDGTPPAPGAGAGRTGLYHEAWAASLDDDEVEAVQDYTQRSERINSSLRNGFGGGDEYLDSALAKASVPETVTVYRGLQHDPGLEVGDVFKDRAYLSLSKNKHTAEDFADDFGNASGGVLFEVKLPKGSPASLLTMDLSPSYASEGEVLGARDSRMRVTGYRHVGDRLVYEAEVYWDKIPGTELTDNADDWRFRPDPDKVTAFREWLKSQLTAVVRNQSQRDLWTRFLEAGFRKGLERSYSDVTAGKKSTLPEDQMPWYAGTRDQFVASSFGQPVAREKVELISNLTLSHLDAVTEDMSSRMVRVLTDGLITGKSPREVARTMAQSVDLGKNRALLIARTELSKVHAEGQLTALKQLGVETLGVNVEWLTAAKPCPKCASHRGKVYTLDEARGKIPHHPNCVSGETVIISPDPQVLMSAIYSGPVVELVTSDGCSLTVTLNHMVMTPSGWVFAKDLKEGDYVVSSLDGRKTVVGPHEYDGYPTVAEIFEAYVKLVHPARVTETLAVPHHLYGDGLGVKEKIQIVDVSGILWDRIFSEFGEKFKKVPFGIGDISAVHSEFLERNRTLQLFLNRSSRASDRVVSSLGVADVILARSLGHVQPVGLNPAPVTDTSELKESRNGAPAQVEPFVNSFDTDAARVKLNDLLDGKLTRVERHVLRQVADLRVYDVSTGSTAYAANGIITSNCKCAWAPDVSVPVTKSGFRFSTNADRNGEPTPIQTCLFLPEEVGGASDLLEFSRWLRDGQNENPVSDEWLDAVSELLSGLGSEVTELVLSDEGPEPSALTDNARYYHRDKLGRFARMSSKSNTPTKQDAYATAHELVRKALKRKPTAKQAEKLAESIQHLTVPQLKALAKAHGLKPSGKLKAQIKESITSKLRGAGAEPVLGRLLATGSKTPKPDGSKLKPGDELNRSDVVKRLESAAPPLFGSTGTGSHLRFTSPEHVEAAAQMIGAVSRPGGSVRLHGMSAPEDTNKFRFNGVDVHYPATPEGQRLVAHNLATLLAVGDAPPSLFRGTSKIVMTEQPNAQDAYWATVYGRSDFRSAATGGNGEIVFYGRHKQEGLLSHELGHNLATHLWKGTQPDPNSAYGRAQAAEPPVTSYAKGAGTFSRSEDFAEAVRLWVRSPTSRAFFRAQFPLKSKALEDILGKLD